jgi:hypothetical protein
MPIQELYHTLNQSVNRLRPKERVTRKRNFVWLMVGLFQSRSVHLSKVAAKMPGTAVLVSKTRRLQRWLANSSVRVREWYQPIAKQIIDQTAGGGMRLLVDGSKVGFGHQLLLISVAYRKRALPLGWTWISSSRGHSTSWKQRALLAYVHGLVPPGTRVNVAGDAEFGGIEVQKLLQSWGWRYVLRQKGRLLVKANSQSSWQRLDSLVGKPGEQVWLEECLLTAKLQYPVNLLAYWKPGEELPWLLATNLPDPRTVVRVYRRRMWIDESFGDLKGNGFDLESTHLRNFLRLSRLTLAVMLLYVWLIAVGTRTIKNGQRRLVDRNDRRDYSIFRIGCNLIERFLSNGQPLSFSLVFYP